jgi:nicotinamidase-related amidase
MINLLQRENTGILIVDVQEKLMPVMDRQQIMTENINKLLQLCRLFSLPVLLTEQYPRWLGPTVPELKHALSSYEPITKMHFNCCDVAQFNDHLASHSLENIIITGVESHICIFQTCVGLTAKGYQIHVPKDAVSSRTSENRQVGLELMKSAGALITSTEAVIYQILKQADTKEFKKMSKIMK